MGYINSEVHLKAGIHYAILLRAVTPWSRESLATSKNRMKHHVAAWNVYCDVRASAFHSSEGKMDDLTVFLAACGVVAYVLLRLKYSFRVAS